MAIAAGSCSPMIHGKPRVTECCPCPGRRVVAGGTVGRESCRDMIRICQALIKSRVAGVAVPRSSCELIVDMTQAALHGGMCTRQRKPGRSVVESRPRPSRRVVARCALLGESRLRMIRIGRAVVVRQMTRYARSRQTGVYSARMA
jgi:hypothetical protein